RSTNCSSICLNWMGWPKRPNRGGNPMSKPIRFGSAISMVALATVIAGCAAPQHHASSASGQPSGEVGLATRALAALAANDPATAVGYAEKAVENTPNDANFRTLLGTAYLAAGRSAAA